MTETTTATETSVIWALRPLLDECVGAFALTEWELYGLFFLADFHEHRLKDGKSGSSSGFICYSVKKSFKLYRIDCSSRLEYIRISSSKWKTPLDGFFSRRQCISASRSIEYSREKSNSSLCKGGWWIANLPIEIRSSWISSICSTGTDEALHRLARFRRTSSNKSRTMSCFCCRFSAAVRRSSFSSSFVTLIYRHLKESQSSRINGDPVRLTERNRPYCAVLYGSVLRSYFTVSYTTLVNVLTKRVLLQYSCEKIPWELVSTGGFWLIGSSSTAPST